MVAPDFSSEMCGHIRMTLLSTRRQVDVGGNKKAIIIFVPYRLLRSYHKIQQRLVRELEKKFRCVQDAGKRGSHLSMEFCDLWNADDDGTFVNPHI